MRLFAFLFIVMICSAYEREQPIFTQQFCEHQQRLLYDTATFLPTVFADLSVAPDTLFRSVIQQLNNDTCALPVLCFAKMVVDKQDTIRVKALIGDFNFNCELDIPLWHPRPLTSILVNRHNQILIENEYLDGRKIDSALYKANFEYDYERYKAFYYSLHWDEKSNKHLMQKIIRGICTSYLWSVNKLTNKTSEDSCSGRISQEFPILFLIISKPIPPPPPPPNMNSDDLLD